METALADIVRNLQRINERLDTAEENAAEQSVNNKNISDNIQEMKGRLTALEVKSSRASPTLRPAENLPEPVRMQGEAPVQQATSTPTGSNSDAGYADTYAGELPDIYSAEDEMFHSGTGLPKTPAPNAKFPSSKPRDSKRRETLLVRNLQEAQQEAVLPVMYGTIGSHAHIHYEEQTISAFRKFWKAVREYMQRERVMPPIPTLIAEKVMERLIADNYATMGEGKYLKLNLGSLYNVMQKGFRPKDRIQFLKALDSNTPFTFSSHYRPTAEYFMPFYDALLVYMASFTEVHDILSHGVSPEDPILPRCDMKAGGLLKSFISKIPYEFGSNVLLVLPEAKYSSLGVFLHTFREKLEQCKSDSECACRLRRLFSGTQYEAKKHETRRAEQKLPQLRDTPDPDAEFTFEERYDEPSEDSAEEDNIDAMLAALAYPSRGKGQTQKPSAGKGDSSRDPFACLTFVLHGECKTDHCKYSHDAQYVRKKRVEMFALLQKQLGPGFRADASQKVSAMVDLDRDADDIY